MHLFHIPQCSIQNRNVHVSVLNGALWDMEQVHSGIYELGQLTWVLLAPWWASVIFHCPWVECYMPMQGSVALPWRMKTETISLEKIQGGSLRSGDFLCCERCDFFFLTVQTLSNIIYCHVCIDRHMFAADCSHHDWLMMNTFCFVKKFCCPFVFSYIWGESRISQPLAWIL